MPTVTDPRLAGLTGTVNETLKNRAIRHSIFLERFKSREVRRIVKFLDDQVIPDLASALAGSLARLTARGIDMNFRTERLRQVAQATDAALETGFMVMANETRTGMLALSTSEAEFEAALLRETAGRFGVDFRTPSPQLLRSIVVSRPMQGRFLRNWFSDTERATKAAVNQQIKLGLASGESIERITRRVAGTRANGVSDGIMSTPRHQIRTLVRTAVNHTSNHARQAVIQENEDVIDKWQFVATLDTRTTEICMSRDGRVYEIGKGDLPPLHLNCRSTHVPVLKSWKALGIDLKEAPEGTRASMGGQVAASETYPSWLKKQSASVQDEALGPTRGRLFRAGKYDPGRYEIRVGDPGLTLDEVRVREGLSVEDVTPRR